MYGVEAGHMRYCGARREATTKKTLKKLLGDDWRPSESNCCLVRCDYQASNMSSNYSSDLAADFEALLQNDDKYDVLIQAGQHPDIKEFRAHSLILRARCSYFEQAFQHTWSEKTEDGHYVLEKPNISPEVFHVILRYLYTGILDCGHKQTDLLIQCLIAADELGLLKLIKEIETYFCKNPDVLEKIAVSAVEVLYKTESVRGLIDRCLEIVSGSPQLLLASERFPYLEKPIMTMILHREDLLMSDVKLWDLLTKWVFAHYLLRKQEAAQSLEDLLKQARQAILEHAPLVGFYDMPEASFYSKVLPYRDLLPADLIASILEHHKDPSLEVPLSYRRSRICKPNSVLLGENAVFDVSPSGSTALMALLRMNS